MGRWGIVVVLALFGFTLTALDDGMRTAVVSWSLLVLILVSGGALATTVSSPLMTHRRPPTLAIAGSVLAVAGPLILAAAGYWRHALLYAGFTLVLCAVILVTAWVSGNRGAV